MEGEAVQKAVEGNKFGRMGRGHITADGSGNIILKMPDYRFWTLSSSHWKPLRLLSKGVAESELCFRKKIWIITVIIIVVVVTVDNTEGALGLNAEEGLQEDLLGGRGKVQGEEHERSPYCLSEAVG